VWPHPTDGPKQLYLLDTAVKIAQVVQGIITPAIAVVIGYFTWRIQRQQVVTQQQQAETTRLQAQTTRLQYRFGLMERRMKVFDATMAFIVFVLRHARIDSLDPIFQLNLDTREHHLLFGKEIGEYIDELYRKGVLIHGLDADRGPHGELRPEHIQPHYELVLWFSGQTDTARELFAKYLDFREP
jgi:hypothetical protein